MNWTFYLLLATAALLLVISLLWRFFSKRKSLPCPSYLSWMVELDNPFTKISRAEVIIHNLSLHAGMKVLDIGCGPGRVTIPLAKAVGPNGKITALDIQEKMLERVQQKALTLHLSNIEYIQGNIGDNKLTSNEYDRALLVTVLGEIVDPQKALKEIFRALKPGGILSITEIVFDPHFQRTGKVIKLAKASGFTIKESKGNFLAYTLLLEKPFSL